MCAKFGCGRKGRGGTDRQTKKTAALYSRSRAVIIRWQLKSSPISLNKVSVIFITMFLDLGSLAIFLILKFNLLIFM